MSAIALKDPLLTVLVLLLCLFSTVAQASLTLYHGPHEDYLIKTQVASKQPLTILVLQDKWALIKTHKEGLEGWVTLPALYNNGYLSHQEYLVYKQQQADWDDRELEWFWQSEQAIGVGIRLPFAKWFRRRWPETADEVLELWPGDQQQLLLRYHRGNQGEEAWHSIQLGFDSRITYGRHWASHLYLGGGLGINEVLSRHWDDLGASRTVPLLGAAMDLRYSLLPQMDLALRLETTQALGGDGGKTNARHSAISLVWILDL